MYIDLKFNLDLNCTQEIEWYVKSKLPEMINEKLFENPQELNKLIKSAVEGQFRQIANEVLQSKDCKKFITEKVWEKLNEFEKSDKQI